MRPRAALAAVSVLTAALLAAATGLGQAHPSKPTRVCHRRHGHRVCTTVHPKTKPHRPGTVTTQTSTSTTSSATRTSSSTTSETTTTTSTSTTATQTTATETTATSTSTAAALPHGTEVDERATGEQSPFYSMNANEPALAAGTIRFNIYNFDQDPHTFAIANSSGVQITNAVNVPAGQQQTAVTLTVNLPSGTYTLFCTLPQHAALGMKTTIVVK